MSDLDWRLSWPPLGEDPQVRRDIEDAYDGYPDSWPRDRAGIPVEVWEVV